MKTLESYNDVLPILHAALEAGGAKIPFDTEGKAKRWRQRAYAAIKLAAELHAKQYHGGFTPPFPLHSLAMNIYDSSGQNNNFNKALRRVPASVIITIRQAVQAYDLNGKPLALIPRYPEPSGKDLLLDAAQELKERLSK